MKYTSVIAIVAAALVTATPIPSPHEPHPSKQLYRRSQPTQSAAPTSSSSRNNRASASPSQNINRPIAYDISRYQDSDDNLPLDLHDNYPPYRGQNFELNECQQMTYRACYTCTDRRERVRDADSGIRDLPRFIRTRTSTHAAASHPDPDIIQTPPHGQPPMVVPAPRAAKTRTNLNMPETITLEVPSSSTYGPLIPNERMPMAPRCYIEANENGQWVPRENRYARIYRLWAQQLAERENQSQPERSSTLPTELGGSVASGSRTPHNSSPPSVTQPAGSLSLSTDAASSNFGRLEQPSTSQAHAGPSSGSEPQVHLPRPPEKALSRPPRPLFVPQSQQQVEPRYPPGLYSPGLEPPAKTARGQK